MRILYFLLLISIELAFAQNKDPELILEKVKNNFAKIKDYEVDVRIKVDVDFIKVPESEAKIFFRQPSKIQVESEGFALIPREGLDFSPVALLKNEYTSFYIKEEKIDGYNTSVIKVIPLNDASDVILSTLWIDESKKIIRKIESSTKLSGTFAIELKYDDVVLDYPLPVSMIFTFNVDRMNLPKGVSGEFNESSKSKDKKDRTTTGKVYINYSNYKINKGIPDSVFEKKQ
jgi:outer membrane lipoprotein-sorting protein